MEIGRYEDHIFFRRFSLTTHHWAQGPPGATPDFNIQGFTHIPPTPHRLCSTSFFMFLFLRMFLFKPYRCSRIKMGKGEMK